jgi:hypothetical protein
VLGVELLLPLGAGRVRCHFREILGAVSKRRIGWPLLMLALFCLVPVAVGVALLRSDSEGSQVLGWGLVGFFGSGVVVLTRKALSAP